MDPTPVLVYAVAVAAALGAMLLLSYLVGERHGGRAAGQPFESGIVPTGDARLRYSAKFYRVAMLFVIFDMEAAFVFAWSVSARENGWDGFAAITVFVAVLLGALFYLARMGALDWGADRRFKVQRQDAKTQRTQ